MLALNIYKAAKSALLRERRPTINTIGQYQYFVMITAHMRLSW